MLEADLVPPLLALLGSEDDGVIFFAASTLANLTATSPKAKHDLIEQQGTRRVVSLLRGMVGRRVGPGG